jgi:hypothetical protein
MGMDCRRWGAVVVRVRGESRPLEDSVGFGRRCFLSWGGLLSKGCAVNPVGGPTQGRL